MSEFYPRKEGERNVAYSRNYYYEIDFGFMKISGRVYKKEEAISGVIEVLKNLAEIFEISEEALWSIVKKSIKDKISGETQPIDMLKFFMNKGDEKDES